MNRTADELAVLINLEHETATKFIEVGHTHFLQVGRFLLQARDLIPHGRWIAWVKENCRFTPRMAQNYLKLATFSEFPRAGRSETILATDRAGSSFRHVGSEFGEFEW